jgi:hypothetical protein
MCGCTDSVPAPEHDYKKEELLRENMSLIPEREYKASTGKMKGMSDDYDWGFSLHVSPSDDDAAHIKSHSEFVKEQAAVLTPQAKSRMSMHVAKHRIQLKAKEV